MTDIAFCTKNVVFSTRFRVTAVIKPFLTQIDGKRIFNQKRRFDTRFRVTVMTNVVSTQNDGKSFFAENVVLAIDFGEQL